MSRTIKDKIKINSFADVCGAAGDSVVDVPLLDIRSFKDHPFKVLDDIKMNELVESIRENGVLVPGIVRPIQKGYELISGHRRKRACEIIGLNTMPVIVKNYTDDEAIISMVDANLQRDELLPSEKAWSYKMKLDAMNRQGSRNDLTSRQIGAKLRTADVVGKELGDSGRQVQRYVRLTELIPELLNLADEKRLGFNPAVELSYLRKKEQELVFDTLDCEVMSPTLSQAKQIRKLSEEKKCTSEGIYAVLVATKSIDRKITIKEDVINRYFIKGESSEEIEEIMVMLLEQWAKREGA